jgi:threonine/homoserine/homoserine lactone efflux protein
MWTFVAAALVLIVIPGPDQALFTRNAIADGRRAGLLTMTGGALGLTVHATITSLGVPALLHASVTAFTVLKALGAGYLVWMGLQTLRTARKCGGVDAPERRAKRTVCYVRQGFLSSSLNPKGALFFVTFLPQFIDPGASPLRQGLLLSAVFAMLYVTWFSLYILTVDLISNLLRRPRVRTGIQRVTGMLLIGFAVRLVMATS